MDEVMEVDMQQPSFSYKTDEEFNFGVDYRNLKPSAREDPLNWYLRVDDLNKNRRGQLDENEQAAHATIELIQALRACSKNELTEHKASEPDDSEVNFLKKRVFLFPPKHTAAWVPVTTVDRKRLYVLTKPESSLELQIQPEPHRLLLGRSLHDLLSEARMINLERNCRIESSLNQEEIQGTSKAPVPPRSSASDNKSAEKDLWVNKYTPRCYLDLLSDDGVNRTLLTWLKLWDQCVFKRQKNRLRLSAGTRRSVVYPQNRKHAKNSGCAEELSEELDKYKRPMYKTVLLCGPPGAGKTTLAETIAKHCGYYVQEMNASDDRTLDSFKNNLEAATQMAKTLDSDPKPHCLIIDEIDGAPANSINYLVSLLKKDDTKGTGKKAGRNQFVLLRPVICICNDLYKSSLRELRKVALVLQLPPIEPRRLFDRLFQICRREDLETEPSSLETLCDKSSNDVRSCINTLQFLKISNTPVTRKQIQNACIGQKDEQKSLFATWSDIFQMPRMKRKQHGADATTENQNGSMLAQRIANVFRAMSKCADEQLAREGLFENYLGMDFRDPRLEKVSFGTEWLCFTDQLECLVRERQMYEFLPYENLVAVVFHLLFASNRFPKIQFPHTYRESVARLKCNETCVGTILNDMTAKVRPYTEKLSLVMDTLPWLWYILQPDIRPMNSQLYSAREKADLRRTVAAMTEYNITFSQQRTTEGQYVFSFEPPIDDIVKFKGVKFPWKELAYAARQLLAHEVVLEKAKMAEMKRSDFKEQRDRKQAPMVFAKSAAPKAVETVDAATKISDSNFLRHATMNSAQTLKDKRRNGLKGFVWYKYHNGCSDVVKRNLRVEEFL